MSVYDCVREYVCVNSVSTLLGFYYIYFLDLFSLLLEPIH